MPEITLVPYTHEYAFAGFLQHVERQLRGWGVPFHYGDAYSAVSQFAFLLVAAPTWSAMDAKLAVRRIMDNVRRAHEYGRPSDSAPEVTLYLYSHKVTAMVL